MQLKPRDGRALGNVAQCHLYAELIECLLDSDGLRLEFLGGVHLRGVVLGRLQKAGGRQVIIFNHRPAIHARSLGALLLRRLLQWASAGNRRGDVHGGFSTVLFTIVGVRRFHAQNIAGSGGRHGRFGFVAFQRIRWQHGLLLYGVIGLDDLGFI